MNSDESFIFMILIIIVAVLAFFGLGHAFNPKTDFTNQCIRHHGIPDTHTNTWVCNGVQYEPK